MTKNEFKKLAKATGKVLWCKYSGHTQTMYVCCLDSHIGEQLQAEAIIMKCGFKVKYG